MPLLFALVTRVFSQPHHRQGLGVKVASSAQAVGELIMLKRFLHLRAEHAVCFAAIVEVATPKSLELQLSYISARRWPPLEPDD